MRLIFTAQVVFLRIFMKNRRIYIKSRSKYIHLYSPHSGRTNNVT